MTVSLRDDKISDAQTDPQCDAVKSVPEPSASSTRERVMMTTMNNAWCWY